MDATMTIAELKEAVHQLCLRKGWGREGVQNPQHIAMAMTVEMSELLEHFQWLNDDDVEKLMRGEDPDRCAMIAEEFADVMMYGLQLTRTLHIDVSDEILRKIARAIELKPARHEFFKENRDAEVRRMNEIGG